MKFLLELMEGQVIGNETLIKKSDGTKVKITNEVELVKLIRADFLRVNRNKSFKEYNEEDEGNYDALDTINSNYNLNINKKYVSVVELFNKVSKTNPEVLI